MVYEIKHYGTHKGIFDNIWRAESRVKLENNREMKITTHKSNSGSVVTSANVGINENNNWVWAPFSDFTKKLAVTKTARATERYIADQHAKAIENIETLAQEAEAFYKK